MSKDIAFPFSTPVLEVVQPLGVFYVAKLSAKLLLEVSYSDPLHVLGESSSGESYWLSGAQREESKERLREIGRFINTVEAAFPNSIILAANYREDGELEQDEGVRWKVESTNGDVSNLVIPSSSRLASIIDGQHRLRGFLYSDSSRSSMDLLCAVYLDLPNPYQAYLFATINFNQKKVDRSLAYELFGINVEEEPPHSWSPEKAAVFFCRRLNIDPSSPFFRHIIVAAQDDQVLFENRPSEVEWAVSTATIVDGILRLFSANPRKDRDLMHQQTIEGGRNRAVLKDDKTPLRRFYRETKDQVIYTAVENYFRAVEQVLWTRATSRSYIRKTVGVQALFDILRALLIDHFDQAKDIRVAFFSDQLSKAADIDFSDTRFQASGIGRSRIRSAILERLES